MPLYLLIGRDIHLGQDRSVAIEADDAQAATSFALSRGIQADSTKLVASGRPADVPPGVTIMRVPAPEPVFDPNYRPVRRRFKLVGIGLGIGVVLILGTLFVLKAREHLTRQEMTPPPGSSISRPTPPTTTVPNSSKP